MKLTDLNCINKEVDLDSYIKFRENVKAKMEHPEWLGDFTKQDLEKLLSNGSKIWIYYLDNEPVCSMMLIPSDKKALLKFGLPSRCQDFADYGPMFVKPKFVGNSLQYQMLKELDKYCLGLGYKYAVVTVHPDNVYSIRNLIKHGFNYKDTKEFTRGIRNIYLKKLIAM